MRVYEWIERCAARIAAGSFMSAHDSKAYAETLFDSIGDTEQSPESAADEDMANWSE